ncbi:MAG TPA: DUF5676 family membrane protein [Candidatus Nanoarchaeia archaeon]|nr:DUF5676 family membrane protein [Candidatus Nanoarchaeia archaeon]
MADKLDEKIVAKTLAVVFGAVYILCVILFTVATQGTLKLFSYMFHGIDITKIAATNLSLGGALIGFIETIVLSFAIGWAFAAVYNKLQKKRN